MVHERLPSRPLTALAVRGLAVPPLPRAHHAAAGAREAPDRAHAGLGPVDLVVRAGTLVLLRPAPLGSTLLACLDGSVADFDGAVEVGGVDVALLRPRDRRAVLARCLAPVRLLASGGPARPLPRASSVREAVAGAVPPALRHPAGAAGAAPALGLDAVLDARPADLDPPTQGLVAVARALVRNPDVLAVDAAALVPDGPPGALLARALRAVVDLEGRTVLVAAAAAALETTADEVVRLPTVWLGS